MSLRINQKQLEGWQAKSLFPKLVCVCHEANHPMRHVIFRLGQRVSEIATSDKESGVEARV